MSSRSADQFADSGSDAHVRGDSCSYVSRKRAEAIVRLQLITVGWMLVECAADFAHYHVAGEAQLAEHLARRAHDIRQIIRRDHDERDHQYYDDFDYAQN